jgi:CheY-like chemotaxis protein
MATVLIAEDNPDNSALLVLMLEHAGHRVFATADGRTALQTAREVHPDLVVLDGKMPGLSGVQVCQALKADPATADIPVIFVTASVEESHIDAALTAGADTYVTKPFSRKDFLGCVRMVLDYQVGDDTATPVPPATLAGLATQRLHFRRAPLAARR